MRRCLEDKGLSCDNRAIHAAFTPGTQSYRNSGRKIQALGVKLLRLRLGLKLMLTFNEYHSYKI